MAVAAGDVSQLLRRASSREALTPADGKSSSEFERVRILDGWYFLKRVSPAKDWVMRVAGDHLHRGHLIWAAGVMDRAPACIDHAVMAMQVDGEGENAE